MHPLQSVLAGLTIEPPAAHSNLTLFPLIGSGPETPGYLILDEALTRRTVHITEVNAGGSVPELKLTNEGSLPVLLLDGEELIGAKQNRVLNLTILAPAKATITIPVSCVEAGRWSHASAEFSSSPRTQFAKARRSKMVHVSHSLAVEGTRRSDQGEVWEEIALKALTLEAESPTGAMAAIYDRHRPRVDEYAEAFVPGAQQVGAIFAVDGRVLGLELFDAAATLAKALPKLVRSYALDAIETVNPNSSAPGKDAASALLQELAAARFSAFPAVGVGQDLRLSGERLIGGALNLEDRVIHLSAFRLENSAGDSGHGRGSGFARASQRRQSWQAQQTGE